MSQSAKDGIMAAIAKASNPDMMAVLLLLLTVLEEIGGKIDAMRADEVGLREAVLNGHASSHDKHHEWVEERIQSNCATACSWAEQKMQAEKTTEDNAKKDISIAREAFIRQLVGALVLMGLGAIGAVLAIK